MLQQIIDRRLAGKNKSIGNRERFLRRHKEQIREAVKRAVDGRGIRDIAQGEDMGRPSTIHVETAGAERLRTVRVGGAAVRVSRGTMRLP